MTPRVTVITPTFNRADLLPSTIRSVLAQTFTDFEYYIIDDGSSDNTKEVVAPFLSDTRLKYVYQENAGEPAAANLGWSLAKGEYFVQINSDDPALPNLLQEMVDVMDAHPKVIVAYCDFHFIDENDNIIKTTRSNSWDFYKNLSDFSCQAAAPGTFFRKTGPLAKWETIRRHNYRHINDLEMYWDMALEGDFLHVPKVLATWREHSGQISYARYEAIDEIRRWFDYYFTKPNLSNDVLACRKACKDSIHTYFIQLILASNLNDEEKSKQIYAIKHDDFLGEHEYSCVQIGDNDLIGNKFNGHDLHLLLQEKNINAWHIVRNKESKDDATVAITPSPTQDYSQQLLRRGEYQFADIVHLHLIHNTDFDIKMLPLMTRLKPTILTLHDPFFMGGHCIYHMDCKKWQHQCSNCPYPDLHFALQEDDSALRFAIKERAFQDSEISLIVASDWMREKVEKSPVFKGKKVYKLPFGIDQTIFKPADTRAMRAKLQIPEDDLVLFFRSDRSPFKGLQTLKTAFKKLAKEPISVTLLTVGQEGLLKEFASDFNLVEFGWLKDDNALAVLYQACDLFLMPSDMEAFGMMAIEAMSCQKMVLSVPGTSLPSVIAAPDCGMVVEKEAYGEALLSLIRSPEEIALRGERSLAYAREHYSRERYIHELLQIYDDVMARFVPSPNAAVILASMSFLGSYNDNSACVSIAPLKPRYTMCKSKSWEITKPLRAFIEMLKALRHGPGAAVKRFSEYYNSESENHQPDTNVVTSISWKITAPLRAVHRLFTKE